MLVKKGVKFCYFIQLKNLLHSFAGIPKELT